MKIVGNIFWFIFGGAIWALVSFLIGVLCCITIILIPIGIKMFHFAGFIVAPFGKHAEYNKGNAGKLVINIIWLVLFGWETIISYALTGAILCCTIILIPFGIQYFKTIPFFTLPLGTTFVKDN